MLLLWNGQLWEVFNLYFLLVVAKAKFSFWDRAIILWGLDTFLIPYFS